MGNDELMGGAPFRIGRLEPGLLQPLEHVVGVQRRVLRHPRQSIPTDHARIHKGS